LRRPLRTGEQTERQGYTNGLGGESRGGNLGERERQRETATGRRKGNEAVKSLTGEKKEERKALLS